MGSGVDLEGHSGSLVLHHVLPSLLRAQPQLVLRRVRHPPDLLLQAEVDFDSGLRWLAVVPRYFEPERHCPPAERQEEEEHPELQLGCCRRRC